MAADVTIRPTTTEVAGPDKPSLAGPYLGAFSLFAGPALLGSGLAIVTWNLASDAGVPNRAAVAADGDRMMLGMNLGSLGNVVMVGAVVALAAVVARRLPKAAVWGAALSILGLASMLVNSVFYAAILATDGVEPTSAVDAWGRAYVEKTNGILVFWLFPLFVVGSLVLAIGLWRSRQVPAWSALCIGVGGLFPIAAVVGVGVVAMPFIIVRLAGSIPLAKSLISGAPVVPLPAGR